MADNPFVGFLKKAFPFISVAAAAGGPLGSLAAQALGKALGQDVKPDATSIADALTKASASADQLMAAQKAEEEFQAQMQKMGFDHIEKLEEIAAGDRASARDREIKTGDKMTPRVLSVIVVAAWVATQSILLFHIVDTSMRELVARVLGTLDSALILVLGYYFGSSAGSAAKDETIRKQASEQ